MANDQKMAQFVDKAYNNFSSANPGISRSKLKGSAFDL